MEKVPDELLKKFNFTIEFDDLKNIADAIKVLPNNPEIINLKTIKNTNEVIYSGTISSDGTIKKDDNLFDVPLVYAPYMPVLIMPNFIPFDKDAKKTRSKKVYKRAKKRYLDSKRGHKKLFGDNDYVKLSVFYPSYFSKGLKVWRATTYIAKLDSNVFLEVVTHRDMHSNNLISKYSEVTIINNLITQDLVAKITTLITNPIERLSNRIVIDQHKQSITLLKEQGLIAPDVDVTSVVIK